MYILFFISAVIIVKWCWIIVGFGRVFLVIFIAFLVNC